MKEIEILIEAFNYCTHSGSFHETVVEKKKLKKKISHGPRRKGSHSKSTDNHHDGANHDTSNVHITFEQFRLLLTCIYLFSYLWDWFLSLNKKADLDQKRINADDFIAVKDSVVDFIIKFKSNLIPDTREGIWDDFLQHADFESKGYVGFDDICFYFVKYVRKPESYLVHRTRAVDDNSDSDKDTEETKGKGEEEEQHFQFESVSQVLKEAEERAHREKLMQKAAELRAKLAIH